jgi:hypothetical protein
VKYRADRNAANKKHSEKMNIHKPMRFALGWNDMSWWYS